MWINPSTLFATMRKAHVVLLVTLPLLVVQAQIEAAVFARETGMPGLSYVYAYSLNSMILLYVLNGWKAASIGFGLVSIGLDHCYFHPELSTLAQVLLALALPVALGLNSHLVERMLEREESEKAAQESAARPHVCEDCGARYPTQNALNAHKRHCTVTP